MKGLFAFLVGLSAITTAIVIHDHAIAPIYKLTPQNNRYEIGVTCTNGGDPTIEGNFDGMLMVSCGKE